jgi:fermentation-respiration switch protein FrsA (DUF1100 family)
MKEKNSRYWRNILLFISAAFILGFLSLVIAISYRQSQTYLHPLRNYAENRYLTEKLIPYQDIELITDDGIKLSAWYTPPQNGVVILLAHGHGSHRLTDIYAMLASHGYGVIAWDFRAHGASSGDFTTIGYHEVQDVKTVLDYVLSQPDVKHIGGLGQSMGAVTLIRAAAQYPQIEAVVSDSAFSTLQDVLGKRVAYPIINPLVKFFSEQQTGVSLNMVNTVDDIGKISPRPVLIIQSTNDQMIPLDSALKLYENAHQPKELWIVDKAPHVGIHTMYQKEYQDMVISFFTQYLLR